VGLAASDSRILQDFGLAESLRTGVGGDAPALGFEAEPYVKKQASISK